MRPRRPQSPGLEPGASHHKSVVRLVAETSRQRGRQQRGAWRRGGRGARADRVPRLPRRHWTTGWMLFGASRVLGPQDHGPGVVGGALLERRRHALHGTVIVCGPLFAIGRLFLCSRAATC